MNMLIELYMQGTLRGEFVLKIGKNNKIDVDIAEVEDSN